MNYRKIMTYFGAAILLMFAAVGVVDPFAAANDASGDTFTEVVMMFTLKFWLLPWAVGVLAAHFFINRENEVVYFWQRFSVLAMVAFLFAFLNCMTYRYDVQMGYKFTGAMFAVGVVMGAILWPMKAVKK